MIVFIRMKKARFPQKTAETRRSRYTDMLKVLN